MNDKTTTVETLKEIIRTFTDARDWGQFHTPKNLSMAVAAEAAELMEIFMWVESKASVEELEKNREDVEHEVADIAAYLLILCSRYNIDLAAAFEQKMKINGLKYPLEKAKGVSTKSTKL